MVIVTLIFLLITGIVFLPFIRELFNKFTKSEQERKEQAKKDKQFRDEGAGLALQRFLFGNAIIDNAKSKKLTNLFEKNTKLIKERQAKNLGFKSVADFEKGTDINRNVTKFNPKGVIGFGISSINQGKGLKDTEENREKLKRLQMIVPTRSFRKGRRRRGIN